MVPLVWAIESEDELWVMEGVQDWRCSGRFRGQEMEGEEVSAIVIGEAFLLNLWKQD